MIKKSRTPLTLTKTVLRPLTSSELAMVAGGSGASAQCVSRSGVCTPSTKSCPHS